MRRCLVLTDVRTEEGGKRRVNQELKKPEGIKRRRDHTEEEEKQRAARKKRNSTTESPRF